MLADILTVQENFNYDIKGKTLVFMGDCKNNVALSFLLPSPVSFTYFPASVTSVSSSNSSTSSCTMSTSSWIMSSSSYRLSASFSGDNHCQT